MKLNPPVLSILGLLAVSIAPLQGAYIQTISFGYSPPGYGASSEIGRFTLQYKSGFNLINGSNGSIDWMTMTVGSTTGDLVRNGVVVTDYFGFSFLPATQQVGIGQPGSPYVGFLPGYFMHSLGSNEWDLRKAYSNNYFDSDSYAPVNYMQVSQAQAIPDGGATGPLMVGSLAGMVAMARFIRCRKSIAASEV